MFISNSCIASQKFLSKTFYLVSTRSIKHWPEPNPHLNTFMPANREARLLPQVNHVPPVFPLGVAPPIKHPKADLDMRGPERIHNQLIYKQYGIIALGGGALIGAHFDVIRDRINRFLDTERLFAVWRVDPPWKPVSKRSLGKKHGGGKAKVHHYETPIKAGRVIVEVAGFGEYEEIRFHLEAVCKKLPIYAMPITQEIMEKIKAEKQALGANNYNPFEYRYLLRNNFSNSRQHVSPFETAWGGTYF